MRSRVAVLALLGAAGMARAGGPRVPVGRLPDTVRPTAYRIELTVDPAAAGFGGHTEIDAVLARPARSLFLHGLGLRVSRARIKAGNTTVDVRYREVHESGVARLDLPATLPAGEVTLSFDHTAAFSTGAEGIFHAEAGGSWYAWTQLEAIDARRVFPCFDEPGFKTPFTVTVTAPGGAKVFANAPEVAATPSGALTVHTFAPTLPLPTYLVALGVGDFEVIELTAPPNAVRKEPLPMRVIATRGQSARMSLAATEGPRLLGFLEEYLGIPFPYPKLDLLSSPAMVGAAMENAGLIIFDDTILLLDPGAPVSQLRAFGEVVAHEMAHQWFGDLVTPAWWTDIWLNESFAEWMGKKVAERWRPDLGIAASELSEAFRAMDADALGRGRPIRQAITESRQIASAFDDITYQKGAQMLTMFESFLGPDRFAEGIRLHLERHRHGTATAEDFFHSLGEAAREPRLVPAMRTFTDQTGVPVVAVSDAGGGSELALSQARYRPLGVRPTSVQTWKIPLCLSRGAERSCTLLETASGHAQLSGSAPLLPNAGGAGYYRFRLDASGWDRLVASAASLPARDALALADSVWADFAAGTGSFGRVVATARALGAHPDRLAVQELGWRLKSLGRSALDPDELPGYRALMRSLFGPRLAALGFDPRAGAYAAEPAAAQALRESLLPLVAIEGRDEELRARLAAAAVASLGGDDQAVDATFRGTALAVAVQERGEPFMRQLAEAMGRSSDPLFRRQASVAIGQADTPELARTALALAGSPGVQASETVWMVFSLSREPGAREELLRLDGERYQRILDAFPGYARSALVNVFDGHCTAADVARIEAHVRPKLKGLGGGELELSQVKERIGLCVALRKAKGGEIAAVLGR
jgi:aminopeptidase N